MRMSNPCYNEYRSRASMLGFQHNSVLGPVSDGTGSKSWHRIYEDAACRSAIVSVAGQWEKMIIDIFFYNAALCRTAE